MDDGRRTISKSEEYAHDTKIENSESNCSHAVTNTTSSCYWDVDHYVNSSSMLSTTSTSSAARAADEELLMT
jgi:hypothetical protein